MDGRDERWVGGCVALCRRVACWGQGAEGEEGRLLHAGSSLIAGWLTETHDVMHTIWIHCPWDRRAKDKWHGTDSSL